eukprot:5837905-Pyramimonas_sp.AAC.1
MSQHASCSTSSARREPWRPGSGGCSKPVVNLGRPRADFTLCVAAAPAIPAGTTPLSSATSSAAPRHL